MVSAYQCAAMQTPSNAVCRACEVSLVRLQDAIVVTSSGAETLPFLASFQLPASLAFFVIYGRIIDLHLLRSTTFALVVAPLLAAYAGFALFLYPAADLLHPHGFTAALAPMLPVGLHGLLKVSLQMLSKAIMSAACYPSGFQELQIFILDMHIHFDLIKAALRCQHAISAMPPA